MLERYPYYTFLTVFAEVYKLDTCTYIEETGQHQSVVRVGEVPIFDRFVCL